MRKLTFEGFLKQYVAELSGVQTASVHKLADRMAENLRLKEPLFLYALTFDKVELLLRYTANSAVAAEYENINAICGAKINFRAPKINEITNPNLILYVKLVFNFS